MQRPKIFISHSTQSDESLAFLEKLYNALADVNCLEILVDLKKLSPGDKWHAQINEWMYECDAAIILLTKDALESGWVQDEATVVAVKDRNEPDFKLIPVILNTVTPETIRCHPRLGHGSAAQLDDTQFVSKQADEDATIECIKSALEGLHPKSRPFGELGRVISGLLHQADQASLEAAWQQLQGDDKPDLEPGADNFSDALIRYLFRQNLDCMTSFKEVVDKIRPKLEPKRASEFFHLIRALWVEKPAAACLNGISGQANKMSAMNGKFLHQFTFERYLERAWPLTDTVERIMVTNNSDFEQIQEQLRNHFQESHNPADRLPPEECDDDILSSDDPILVCIPADDAEGGLPDPRIRQQLIDTYPNVMYVLGTGENLPEKLPNDVLCIEPPLKVEVESRQRTTERRVSRFLNSYCER